MPRFSANLGFLFSDRPEIERVAAAASCGFKAVEMHWPYHVPAHDMRDALGCAQGLLLVVISLRDSIPPQEDSREEQTGQYEGSAESRQALANGVASR